MNKMEVLAALQANQSSKKGARLSATRIYTAKIGDTTWGPAPQCRKLIEIMYSCEEMVWNEVQLHELIMEHTEISVKQTPWEIFTFYRKQLIDRGFLTMQG